MFLTPGQKRCRDDCSVPMRNMQMAYQENIEIGGAWGDEENRPL
jgi:hypothetical protein